MHARVAANGANVRLLLLTLPIAAIAALSGDLVAASTVDAKAYGECQAMLAKRMPADRFWSIVEQTSGKDGLDQAAALQDALKQKSADDVLAFDMTLRTEHLRAYRWDLWAVGYIANGGMSDDGFEYFRYWLVSRGRSVFERVSGDPDALADIVPRDRQDALENEAFGSATAIVWIGKTKRSFEAYGALLDALNVCQPMPSAPSGTKAASLKDSYPKTWKRFGHKPLESNW